MSRRTTRLSLALAAALLAAALLGCRTAADVRIENASPFDFTDVTVAGEPVGDVPAGTASDYANVRLFFRYALVELTANGHRVNAQTLNFWSDRFTHRVEVLDLAAGHLAVDVVRE